MGINNSLLKSIQTLIDKAVNIAPFDKTRQAQIITNNGDGTYTIRLDGVLYNNVPTYPSFNKLESGKIVKIIIPSNLTSQMYIQPYRLQPDLLIGEIKIYAGVYEKVPLGWLICDGSSQLISDYPELAKALYDEDTSSYIYGSVDSLHFNLPDLRGRVPLGVGNGTASGHTAHTLGQLSGAENHTLNVDEMPSHTHTQASHRHNRGGAWYNSSGTSTGNAFRQSASQKYTSAYTGYATPTINASGGDGAHNNMMPYLGINYIIYAGIL